MKTDRTEIQRKHMYFLIPFQKYLFTFGIHIKVLDFLLKIELLFLSIFRIQPNFLVFQKNLRVVQNQKLLHFPYSNVFVNQPGLIIEFQKQVAFSIQQISMFSHCLHLGDFLVHSVHYFLSFQVQLGKSMVCKKKTLGLCYWRDFSNFVEKLFRIVVLFELFVSHLERAVA